MRGLLAVAVNRFTVSEAFVLVWLGAQRLAHRIVSDVLTTDIDVVELEDGRLILDLGETSRRFQEALVSQGFNAAAALDLAGVTATAVLAKGAQLEQLETERRLVGQHDAFVWTLFLLTLVTTIGSVAITHERRALSRLGVGGAPAMVLVAVRLGQARRGFLEAVGGNLPPAVAANFFGTLAASMRTAFRRLCVGAGGDRGRASRVGAS